MTKKINKILNRNKIQESNLAKKDTKKRIHLWKSLLLWRLLYIETRFSFVFEWFVGARSKDSMLPSWTANFRVEKTRQVAAWKKIVVHYWWMCKAIPFGNISIFYVNVGGEIWYCNRQRCLPCWPRKCSRYVGLSCLRIIHIK